MGGKQQSIQEVRCRSWEKGEDILLSWGRGYKWQLRPRRGRQLELVEKKKLRKKLNNNHPI
jgi:hypothetical protein